jgi:hypothetical protein
MSTVYTYSNARQNFASLLDEALQEGQVKVKRKDGQVFVIKPERKGGSAFSVESVALNLTTDEIVGFVREGRRDYGEQ